MKCNNAGNFFHSSSLSDGSWEDFQSNGLYTVCDDIILFFIVLFYGRLTVGESCLKNVYNGPIVQKEIRIQ